jgi:[ribosomal protein S18]-alanine N-acetyltransferase
MATSRGFGAPFVFRPLDAQDVQAIRAWRELGPYAEYDPAPADQAHLLDSAYGPYAIAAPAGELVGFCCFGPDARVSGGDYSDERPLDLALGARPNLTGRGFELTFVRALLSFARQRFVAESFRATIAADNRRDVRMLGQWSAFKVTGQFTTSQGGGKRDFFVLTLKDRRAG